MDSTSNAPPLVQRAHMIALAARAKEGDQSATLELENKLLTLFEHYQSAPKVAYTLKVSPATLYRWLMKGNAAGTLGDILRERGVITSYDGRDAEKRPGRRKGFKVVG